MVTDNISTRQNLYGYSYGAIIIIIPGNTTAHYICCLTLKMLLYTTPLIIDCSRQLETTRLILHYGEETNGQVHIAVIKYIDLYFFVID